MLERGGIVCDLCDLEVILGRQIARRSSEETIRLH